MHPIGCEPMTSPSTLLLRGEEVPFVLDLNGHLPEFRNTSLSSKEKFIHTLIFSKVIEFCN